MMVKKIKTKQRISNRPSPSLIVFNISTYNGTDHILLGSQYRQVIFYSAILANNYFPLLFLKEPSVSYPENKDMCDLTPGPTLNGLD